MKPNTTWVYILHISVDSDCDTAWNLLQEAGLEPLYSEEDPEMLTKIYLKATPGLTEEKLLNDFAFIEHLHVEELGYIDWQAQWEAHGGNYHDGFVHLDVPAAVSDEWKRLRLKPGAGFGDLSHPTTRLVLQMMKDIKGHDVVDIGCGSGVLALNAKALGAKHVYAIDIDEIALEHAHENALVNGMENDIHFYVNRRFQLPEQVTQPVILMNMIMSEQAQAWDSLKSLHNLPGTCLISGILAEQKQAYLDMVEGWGWKLESEISEDGWLGLKFNRN